MHGFLNLSKPQGPTSFDIIRRLKKVLPRKTKLGHLGTLDPMASGVLPVAIGQATRLIHFIEDADKEYIATMILGGQSDTQDAWGQVTLGPPVKADIDQVKELLKSFKGNIKQIPPMYSAVHHEGKRLYDLARQGITVERNEREINIAKLDLLKSDVSLEYPELVLRVVCSKGTYIRTLCHDIGEKLGTGAYMSALLRSRAGTFGIEEAINPDDILAGRVTVQECLLPLEYPLGHIPAVAADVEQSIAVLHGNPIIMKSGLPSGLIRVYSLQQELLAIARSEPLNNGTLIKPVRVLKSN